MNKLDSIAFSIPEENVINCALLSIKISNEIVDGVSVNTTHNVNISSMDIAMLLNELRAVDKIMDKMNEEKQINGTTITEGVAEMKI